jgi:uncharacterized protein (TIGR03000 family)
MRSILFVALLGVSVRGLRAEETAAAPGETGPATVRVTLPADAPLTVDGQATRSTSGRRLFVTPPLEAGKSFRYTFRASFPRAGKTIAVEQQVVVRAGRETLVVLDVPAEAAGAPFARGGLNGSGYETRSYYQPPEPPAPPRAVSLPASPGSDRPGPREGRTDGGFKPVRWGTDPSDPFYQCQ